eukprot:CAMPEP_0183345830 /NCGR_PEP_ID=MMETSP0164_2-20130417/11140_1 /TAXON_ID=221442 /ORGANISM="Coccolithus pelagicus ssp braarudi, Strain PLY182g" /LENGTH=120 /DNA_ID=CAMNT_0025517021 /DNA_START=79 /DNA_END=442 /DNA_ORIENTATION=-
MSESEELQMDRELDAFGCNSSGLHTLFLFAHPCASTIMVAHRSAVANASVPIRTTLRRHPMHVLVSEGDEIALTRRLTALALKSALMAGADSVLNAASKSTGNAPATVLELTAPPSDAKR